MPTGTRHKGFIPIDLRTERQREGLERVRAAFIKAMIEAKTTEQMVRLLYLRDGFERDYPPEHEEIGG